MPSIIGQVNISSSGPQFQHRGHQKTVSNEELVVDGLSNGIFGVKNPQRSNHRLRVLHGRIGEFDEVFHDNLVADLLKVFGGCGDLEINSRNLPLIWNEFQKFQFVYCMYLQDQVEKPTEVWRNEAWAWMYSVATSECITRVLPPMGKYFQISWNVQFHPRVLD